MVEVWLPVTGDIEVPIRLEARDEALIIVSIRRVDGNGAVAITVTRKEGANLIADFASAAFLKSRKTKPLSKTTVFDE